MSKNNTQNRLGDKTDKYIRPKKTVQDKLTPNQIKDLLKDYVEVANIKSISLNTHVRYFSKQKDGRKVFRIGGYLINNKKADKYIVLSNRIRSWSVNTKGSIFFKKISTDELTEVHNDEIDELKQIIKSLYNENKKLKEKISN